MNEVSEKRKIGKEKDWKREARKRKEEREGGEMILERGKRVGWLCLMRSRHRAPILEKLEI